MPHNKSLQSPKFSGLWCENETLGYLHALIGRTSRIWRYHELPKSIRTDRWNSCNVEIDCERRRRLAKRATIGNACKRALTERRDLRTTHLRLVNNSPVAALARATSPTNEKRGIHFAGKRLQAKRFSTSGRAATQRTAPDTSPGSKGFTREH
jgi:hypothetical protein